MRNENYPELMDHISLDALKIGNSLAWKSFIKNMKPLALNACGGNIEDYLLEEVIQESNIALVIKLQDSKFTLTSKLSTYMYSISRNQYLKLLRKTNLGSPLIETSEIPVQDAGVDFSEKEVLFDLIEQNLQQIGEKCKKLLSAYYFERKSMLVIANEFGYSNDDSAKNMKTRCFQKLKSLCNA